MKVKIKFEPRDIWIGCYWNKENSKMEKLPGYNMPIFSVCNTLKVYICVIPMFPIILEFNLK